MPIEMNLEQRSRLYLSCLEAVEANGEVHTANGLRKTTLAELVAYHGDKLPHVISMQIKIDEITAERPIVSITKDHMLDLMGGDKVAAHLVAGMCGLVLLYDDEIEVAVYHTFGQPLETWTTKTSIVLTT